MKLPVVRSNHLIIKSCLALMFAAVFCALGAVSASASPGTLRILIIDSYAGGDRGFNLMTQLNAEPGVVSALQAHSSRIVDGGLGTPPPTAAELGHYDGVVVANDYPWVDDVALGNALADYEDEGGVVIAPNWNFWDEATDPGYAVLGRWSTGGYSPFLQNMTGTEQTVTLGAHDGSHPIFTGVNPLTNIDAYNSAALAPGATQLASWDNGSIAAALKGRAVGINGWLGDNAGITGNYGHFIVNAIKALGLREVTVTLPGKGVGSVSSSAGAILCGTTCAGNFLAGASMTLSAKAAKGSAFAGWTGACVGSSTCSLTVGYPGSDATLWNTPAVGAIFTPTHVKVGGYANGKLKITLPAAGQLTVTAPGTRTNNKNFKRSGLIKIAVKPKPSLKKRIATNGSVKVRFSIKYRPYGAKITGITKKTVKLTK